MTTYTQAYSLQRNQTRASVGVGTGTRLFGHSITRVLVGYLAVRFNEPAVIEALLDAGADASARDSEGKTSWDYAQDLEGAESEAKDRHDQATPQPGQDGASARASL